MKSLPQSNLSSYILKRYAQKLSDREQGFKSSLYAGITISNFLDLLELDEEDTVVIKVGREKYNPDVHDYMVIKKYTIKQELVRKEFKEKIILQLGTADDILRVAPETREFKSTYGYVVKIIVHITTVQEE
jgi:hypothetical protein